MKEKNTEMNSYNKNRFSDRRRKLRRDTDSFAVRDPDRRGNLLDRRTGTSDRRKVSR